MAPRKSFLYQRSAFFSFLFFSSLYGYAHSKIAAYDARRECPKLHRDGLPAREREKERARESNYLVTIRRERYSMMKAAFSCLWVAFSDNLGTIIVANYTCANYS